MKVLIVGEGKHELGERLVPNDEGGALETLVRRLVAVPIECECDYVGRSDLHVHHGKGRGYLKKAIAWMREGEKRGFDAVVFVIDQDKWPDRVRDLNAAQEHIIITRIRRAMGVAIRTFDAWMLADEQAVSAVLGQTVQRQPDPEEIPDGKSIFAGWIKGGKRDIPQWKLYAQIAEGADLATIETRCPQGFGVFAARVRAMVV